MENYTKEQVEAMSTDEIVSLLNELKSKNDMYLESSNYWSQRTNEIKAKMDIIKSVINL